MFDREYWSKLFAELLVYAAENPWQFLYYVLLILSPFFLLSAFLSWKLAKAIEKEKYEKKAKAKRQEKIDKIKAKQQQQQQASSSAAAGNKAKVQ